MTEPWSKDYMPDKATLAKEWQQLRLESLMFAKWLWRKLRLHSEATYGEVLDRDARRCAGEGG